MTVKKRPCRPTTALTVAILGMAFAASAGGAEEATPLPTPGACCLPDGSCQSLIQQACGEAGGSWFGPGVACIQCQLVVRPTLTEIQNAITSQGKNWTAADHSVWKESWTNFDQRLGLKFPPDTAYVDQGWVDSDLPASFDWRNKDGRNYMSPVKNQGFCGSCWAFSAVGVLEALLMIRGYSPCGPEDLSEQFVVSCNNWNMQCFGGYPRSTARFMVKNSGVHYGAPTENCFPYTSNFMVAPRCANACVTWPNEVRAIDDWKWIRSSKYYDDGSDGSASAIDSMKSAIRAGPVWTTMTVMSDFKAYDSGVYEYTKGEVEGGHAVVACGWDDDNECFIVRNSWGTDWGENGYFRIGYSQLASPVFFGSNTIFYVLSAAGDVACLDYDIDIGTGLEWIGGNALLPIQQDEQVLAVELPFTDKFFCHYFDQMSISSNGWLCIGAEETNPWYSWFPIPGPEGPPGMIAPMWTDLDPSETMGDSGIYARDTGDGRFVVEYRNVKRWGIPAWETFEVVLFDPALYPTATGEGKIQFHYLQHQSDQVNQTVGIENPTELCGIQIWNEGAWPPFKKLQPGMTLAAAKRDAFEAASSSPPHSAGRGGTPIEPGMSIEFNPVANGDEFPPMSPAGFQAEYSEPHVRLLWVNPNANTNGFPLGYLNGVLLSEDGVTIAELAGDPDQAMQYDYRWAQPGTHQYSLRARVGELLSDPVDLSIVVPQATHYRDHNTNNVVLTVTDQGTCGFLDADPLKGSGFRVGPAGQNCLYVGSLWVGTGPQYALNRDFVADAYRDWQPIRSFGFVGDRYDGFITGYDDAGHCYPAGLKVYQQSRAWTGAPYDDFVMIDYNLHNGGSEPIENLYVGQYMDWDISTNPALNQGKTDAATQMAYMWRDASFPYVGVALLGATPANLTLIHNPTYVWPNEHVPDLERFFFLSAADANHAVSQSWEVNDWSALVSAGPFALQPGQMIRVSFAVIGGSNEADLLANAGAAHAKYAVAPSGLEELPSAQLAPRLIQNTPNPFDQSTAIRYTLDARSTVELSIYDAAGRLVRTLVQSVRPAGPNIAHWDGRNDRGEPSPSGIYFYRIRTDHWSEACKMVLVRAAD